MYFDIDPFMKTVGETYSPETLQHLIDDGTQITEKIQKLIVAATEKLTAYKALPWKSTVILEKTHWRRTYHSPTYTTNEVYIRQRVQVGEQWHEHVIRHERFEKDWRKAREYAETLAKEFGCEVKVDDRKW